MMHSSAGRVRVDDNPAVSLGAVLGALYRAGRDKLTFIISPPIAAFGLWVEQLIAESTGKNGIGIVPICDEPIVDAKSYADDRVFVYLKLTAAPMRRRMRRSKRSSELASRRCRSLWLKRSTWAKNSAAG